jgi:hypothetical protein
MNSVQTDDNTTFSPIYSDEDEVINTIFKIGIFLFLCFYIWFGGARLLLFNIYPSTQTHHAYNIATIIFI